MYDSKIYTTLKCTVSKMNITAFNKSKPLKSIYPLLRKLKPKEMLTPLFLTIELLF